MSTAMYVFVKSDASYADFAAEAANYFDADFVYIEKPTNPNVQYVFYIDENDRAICVWVEYIKDRYSRERSNYNYGLRIIIEQWPSGSRLEAEIQAARDVFEALKKQSPYELLLLRDFDVVDHHIPPAHSEDDPA